MKGRGYAVNGRLAGAEEFAREHHGLPLIIRLRCGEEAAVQIAVGAAGDRLTDFYPDGTAYRDYLAAHEGREVDFEIQEQ